MAGQFYSLVNKDLHKDRTTDISVGGIGMVTSYFLPHGLRVKLVLAGGILGINRLMRLKGEVCYCLNLKHGKYKCGIKFIDPPTTYLSKFNEYKSAYEKRKEPRITLSD
ncbi:MAG: PilZ domain-containing protein [Candidatus Omnitrophota bacterium]